MVTVAARTLPRATDTHEISNWRIVDFNGARGEDTCEHENTRFLIPIGEHLYYSPRTLHVPLNVTVGKHISIGYIDARNSFISEKIAAHAFSHNGNVISQSL